MDTPNTIPSFIPRKPNRYKPRRAPLDVAPLEAPLAATPAPPPPPPQLAPPPVPGSVDDQTDQPGRPGGLPPAAFPRLVNPNPSNPVNTPLQTLPTLPVFIPRKPNRYKPRVR